jgi:hypothetical protein
MLPLEIMTDGTPTDAAANAPSYALARRNAAASGRAVKVCKAVQHTLLGLGCELRRVGALGGTAWCG